MPKAPINGIDLYYESHGDESAPTIIFAHGRGGNHMSWWQQVAAFSSDFRCITFDHRGWGDSIAEHGSPLRENFISDLIALLDYLQVDKAFLVAQSMGGFSCLGFALAHPERTLGLVLGDTTGGVATEGTLAALDGATPPPDGPARSLAASFIDENPAMTFLYMQIGGLNPPRGEDGVISGFRLKDGPNVAEFAGWKIPTMLIVGKEDAIFPPNVIAEVQKVIPGSQMEIVPGAAHSAHFEQATIFNNLLSEFLKSVLSGSAVGAIAG